MHMFLLDEFYFFCVFDISNLQVKLTGECKSWVCIATKTEVLINFVYSFYGLDDEYLFYLSG